MLRADLLELIRNGENSGVEFKRDDVHADNLAREICALLNLRGGHILLGIEDDGTVTGLTRAAQDAEQWVVNVCRNNVEPAIIPYWETIIFDEGVVGILSLPEGAPDKPYKGKRGSAWVTFVRVGSTSRVATREEEQRLYQAAGLLRYDIKVVPGSSLDDMDQSRLVNYFRVVRDQPEISHQREAWERQLANVELLVEDRGRWAASVGGLLLFGTNPNRLLPQGGITATAFPGPQKDYATVDEEVIRGPLVPVVGARGRVTEPGVIDRTLEFVKRNMGTTSWLEGGRRKRKSSYPLDALREALVNAVAHRDYSIIVTDIEVCLYSDHMDIISPGRLPNTVTVEKMRQGYRAARNELLKEVLRDYGYIEHRGMGVPYKLIAGMRSHNGTEPDLIEDDERFVVRLWKRADGTAGGIPTDIPRTATGG